jgi:hypothetical protein
MPVVHVRHMRVFVGHRRVPVQMRVGLGGRLAVLVHVVLVVNMGVVVL